MNRAARRSSTSRRRRCSTSATARSSTTSCSARWTRPARSMRACSTATSRSASPAASPPTTSPSSTGRARRAALPSRSRCTIWRSPAWPASALGVDAGLPARDAGPGDPQARRRREQARPAGAGQRAVAGEGRAAAGGAGRPALALLGGLPLDPQQPGLLHQGRRAQGAVDHQRAAGGRQVDHRVRAGAGLRAGRDAGAAGRPRSAQSQPAQDHRRRQPGRRVEPADRRGAPAGRRAADRLAQPVPDPERAAAAQPGRAADRPAAGRLRRRRQPSTSTSSSSTGRR